MTNEMILKNKMLNDEQLDKVTGGTVGELADLAEAMLKSNSVLKKFGKVAALIPGVNNLLAKEIVVILKHKLGIAATIDLGWSGTGFRSDANTYKDISTGRSLSHNEVLKRINSLKK